MEQSPSSEAKSLSWSRNSICYGIWRFITMFIRACHWSLP